jgi:anhydro-N-acetylmuramic acid kinase
MPDSSPTSIRSAIGIMTGTSIDGIDAALVEIDGRGLSMRVKLVHQVCGSLGALAKPLRSAAEQQPMAAGEFARLAWEFGVLHCKIVERLLHAAAHEPNDVALICAHGQTVFHQPPVSWQLLNPAPLGARFKCPVITDLRQADLAAGGQGAPVTPIADWIMFRDADKRRAIVNLGGFCNITILPASDAGDPISRIAGFDVCPCNQLLDAIARDVLGKPFDENGRAAAAGRADELAAKRLHETLTRLRSDRRSLGTGDEAIAWIKSESKRVEPNDLAASAIAAIVRCINDSLAERAIDELIVAGGGTRNRSLIHAIARASGIPLQTSEKLGVPIEAREAMAFAILGALCADGVPITLPQVTGCRTLAPICGSWSYPAKTITGDWQSAK